MYTTIDAVLMITDCTNFSKTFSISRYYITVYIFPSKHFNLPAVSSNLTYVLILISLIIHSINNNYKLVVIPVRAFTNKSHNKAN